MSSSESGQPRDPSKLSFQSDATRRSVLATYWVVILLSIPIWWYMTSIQRLSLPSSRVFAQANRRLRLPIHVHLPPRFPSVANQLQHALDDRARNAPGRWQDVEVKLHADVPKAAPVAADVYTVHFAEDITSVEDRTLLSPLGSIDLLADLLSDLLVPLPSSPNQEYRVVQYSPRYRIAFSLLNEDASEGKHATGWDIHLAIAEYIVPIKNELALLHNFTIESQVQFHAPLAFQPQVSTNNRDGALALTPEDLTIFVNSAEWTLSSSVSNDPVLHFILFIPSARRPLLILDEHGQRVSSNTFLLPQWGGIVIYNPPLDSSDDTFHLTSSDLRPIFSSFSSQLLALLGVPPLPKGVKSSDPDSIITRWQFDALVRRRILENTHGSQETLKSIVRLVDQIKNMPIGDSVKGDVSESLHALDKVYDMIASSPVLALQFSSSALSLASRAFFDPDMLALLYFPPEHKYAVYAPLFASAMIPLIVAILREVAAWRRSRRRLREVAMSRDKME